jgi:hypothetical protein
VYGWGRGKGEYPAFWSATLAPRATAVCSLATETLDVDRLEPGRYELSAELNLASFDVHVVARRQLSLT